LFSDIGQRGAVQFFRLLSHGPSTPSARRPRRAQSRRDVGPLDHVGERAAVLRTLIEECGGEADSTTLRRRLVQRVSWKEARSNLWLRGMLSDLEQSGALNLEGMNETEVIARILPDGVRLAYDLEPDTPAQSAAI
jgi:hypothetical protein